MKKQELHQLLKSLEKNDWFRPNNKEAKLSGGKSLKKGLRRSKRIKKKGSRKLRKLSGGKKKTYWQHSKKVLKPALQYGVGGAIIGAPGVAAVYGIRRSKKVRRNRLNRRSKRHSLKRQNRALYAEYSKYA